MNFYKSKYLVVLVFSVVLVPLSTNFLESVVDSKIEYLIVLFYDMFLVQLSTHFRNRAGLCTPPGDALQFWIPPTPREIRLKKLNVSPNLYCNVLSLIVYFVGKLMY